MEEAVIPSELQAVWPVLGGIGAVIFYARFYLQWIYSEIRQRSVIPIGFWYLSALGSLMLLIYAVSLPSPVGALSHSFNAVVYARNLHFVWRDRGHTSRLRAALLHGAALLVVTFGLTMLVVTWVREMEVNPGHAVGVDTRHFFWIAVGAVGQALFALRFIVQWLATERAGKSVVPTAFWYLSLTAATLLMSAHLSRGEWIFVIGLGSTLFVYLRNIILIRRGGLAPGSPE